MEKRLIYCDNAATTPVSSGVLEAMLPALTSGYGNPSSVHSLGRQAARSILSAREKTARALGASVGEIYFTSGGTESDNWAVKGAAELGAANGKRHIVTTSIEHHAVLRSCEYLEKHGFEVTYLSVDEYGLVAPEQVRAALRSDTCLVSVMFANNEIGTIEPVAEIGAVCRENGVLFHTDAVQAFGQVKIDPSAMNIDLLSLSGHKLHAPKGVGVLYVRSGIALPKFMDGGAQERGRRSGTENLPGILGMGQAMSEAAECIHERAERLAAMRDKLIEGLLRIPMTHLNGHPTERLPGNVNVSIRGIEGESLLLMLDTMGICASSGSACASGAVDPSHVLTAIGLPEDIAQGSLRLTLGDDVTDGDIDYIIDAVTQSVARIRAMSPLWERICREEGANSCI